MYIKYMKIVRNTILATNTAQKMKFSIKYFFSKCDQIRRKLEFLCNKPLGFLGCETKYLI